MKEAKQMTTAQAVGAASHTLVDSPPPCESAASQYRVGLIRFESGRVLVFQGGVFGCSSRMTGNLQVRFLEGWAPAMAPGHSTCGTQRLERLSQHKASFPGSGNVSRIRGTVRRLGCPRSLA